MDLIRWSMNRPVSVAVAVILVVVFGLIGLGAIPIQLTPTADRPLITVTTSWPGRGPEEVVDEITKEQEKVLKNVKNLKTMRSTSREGASEISLEFYLGANINRALQEVSDALRQVPQYPEEVDEPIIKAADGAAQNAIAWIIIDRPDTATDHPEYDITTLFTAMDREVRPFLERIEGVAQVNIYGGREREVRVLLDASRLAQRNLTHQDVVTAMRGQNRNISAGTIAEGKRDYRVRVTGQYTSADEVLDTVVAYRPMGAGGAMAPVLVRDLGTAEIGHEKQRGFVRSDGHPCLAMNVIRQGGANVIKVMDQVRTRLDVVQKEMLPRLDQQVGPSLRIRQVYDETVYINSSIDLVLQNLREGAVLSVIVLLLFLRSIRSTLIISLTIPICVIGTFLVMLATGRTLNVVSLAGLAFSTGVVVDNAIVVLENIDRRRKMGDTAMTAVYNGTKEVWGAVLAGTLCHVAVFVPLLTIQEEAGQIFFDLILALSVSILLSMVAAITVVPAAAAIVARISGEHLDEAPKSVKPWRTLWGATKLLDRLGDKLGGLNNAFVASLLWAMTGWRGYTIRPLIIIVMSLASVFAAKLLTPPLDYLPAGNQNLVFGGLLVPPGLSLDEQSRYAHTIEDRIRPYLKASIKDPASVAGLMPIPRFDEPGAMFAPVPIQQCFVGAFEGQMFVGATSQDPQRVIPIGNLLTMSMNGMPDAYGGAGQSSIFSGIGEGGNKINLEISGPDLNRISAAAGAIVGKLFQDPAYGPRSVSPSPANFNLTQPEWRVELTRTGRELGLRTSDLGLVARGLFDGAYAGDFQDQGRKIDIKVLPLGGQLSNKEQLPDVPVSTPMGRIVPLNAVAQIVPSRAPQAIQRIEELPSVTLAITPPAGRALESVMTQLREEFVAPLAQAGVIDPGMRVRLEGSAAKLDEVRAALLGAPADPSVPRAWWQNWLRIAGVTIGVVGFGVAVFAWSRGMRRSKGSPLALYAAAGAILLAGIIGGILAGMGTYPDLVLARMVWTVMIIYLLMCALFESFLYPFVIMFSVPLGIVGGFGALRLVHDYTLRHPEQAPQQLDVLTMIGFVILIGTVVNNAILIVEQARNFMGEIAAHGGGIEGQERMEPLKAISESVRSRVRPIFMTTLTTLGGGIPLVIAPGAGSEMYRGLGAVVVGGLAVSTLFTLVLVPLVFSLVLEMWMSLKRSLARA